MKEFLMKHHVYSQFELLLFRYINLVNNKHTIFVKLVLHVSYDIIKIIMVILNVTLNFFQGTHLVRGPILMVMAPGF